MISMGVKMSKSAKPLPIRQSDDGKWEVEMRGGKWVRCETEADAKVLSDAPVLEALWLKTRPLNKALAARLENTAEKMEQYNMRTDARRFRKWAKLARGKGS
jgi:hypothetical protein